MRNAGGRTACCGGGGGSRASAHALWRGELTVLFWYAVTPAGQRPDINKNANIDSGRADLVVTEPPQSRGERRKWRALKYTHTRKYIYKKVGMHASGAPEVSRLVLGPTRGPIPESVLPPLAKVSTAFPRTWGNINSCASIVLQLYTLLPAIAKWTYKYCYSYTDLFRRNKEQPLKTAAMMYLNFCLVFFTHLNARTCVLKLALTFSTYFFVIKSFGWELRIFLLLICWFKF
jgi:hypothetical protein